MATRTARARAVWHFEVPAVERADLGVAAMAGAAQLVSAFAGARHGALHHASAPAAIVLLAAGPVALVFRRRHSAAVLAVALVASLMYLLAGYGRGPLFVSLLIALFSALADGERRAAVASLTVGYLGFLFLRPALGWAEWPSAGATLALAAWLLVLFAAGEALRVRRVRAVEAAHVRAAEARRTASEERLRLARELHDVLAHNISLINVQAGAALHRAERNEDNAYEALATIKRVSRETLVELRSLLGALREVDEAAPRAPAPTLQRLGDLAASAAAAGVTVTIDIVGPVRDLPASVDLAAYRIVQESLTNVARHGQTTAANLRIEYHADYLVVQVDDDGWALHATPITPGTGITGMTERAIALGGTLEAGPRPGGGFRVRAHLPVPSGAGSGTLAGGATP